MSHANGFFDINLTWCLTKSTVAINSFRHSLFQYALKRVQSPSSRLGRSSLFRHTDFMRYSILIFAMAIWTQAQANSNYNSSSRETIEMTYDDLADELAMKKREALPTAQTQNNWGRSEWGIGYAISTMQYQFPQNVKAIGQNGLDFRYNQSFLNSSWSAEGSIKKFGSMSTGSRSAESEVLGLAAVYQEALVKDLSFTMGIGSSFNWIHVRDSLKHRDSMDWALRGAAGLKGPLTQQFSWAVEMNASSPISGKILKGGLETSLLIRSSM